MRKQNSIVLSHLILSLLLQQPQGTNTGTKLPSAMDRPERLTLKKKTTLESLEA